MRETRRGRRTRPVLARIADKIEGMDYPTLIAALASRQLPDEHWRWTGDLDGHTRSGVRTRKERGTFEAGKARIRLGNKLVRVDRILFAHWVNNGEPLHPQIQVRYGPSCRINWCVNPGHKRLHAVFDPRTEERQPLPRLYLGFTAPPVESHDEIEDLVGLILEQDSRDVSELLDAFEDYSEAEIVEALRRIPEATPGAPALR